jgi:hypothetical protein
MRRLKVIVTAILMCAVPTACLQQQQQTAASTEEEKSEMAAEPPLHLGAVHQVYPQQGFALLRIIGPMPKGGTVLISHPADGSNTRIGNLVVSSEYTTRNNIIAADIRSGEVMRGDRIFQYRSINPGQTAENSEEAALSGPRPIIDSIPDSAVMELQQNTPEQEAPAIPEGEEDNDTVIESYPTVDKPAEQIDNQPANGSSINVPSYLDEIPDDISGWN